MLTTAARACALLLLTALAALVPCAARAQLDLHLYGDLGYHADRAPGAARATDGFGVSSFDFFATGSADRFSFLGELLFEYDPGSNELHGDLERATVQYLAADFLRIRVGRFHSALGYYNDEYHHGTYPMLATRRPVTVSFEDMGGLLPNHVVGVHLDGRIAAGGAGAFRYDLEVGNGRNVKPEDVPTFFVAGGVRAAVLRLRYEPGFVEDLTIGVNGVLDEIPANVAAAASSLHERIAGVHLAWMRRPLHFIAEGYAISHVAPGAAQSYATRAGFVEAGYALGDVQPYARLERVFYGGPDPYYLQRDGGVASFSAIVAGAKWTASERVAVKIEGSRKAFDAGDDALSGAVQVAYAF